MSTTSPSLTMAQVRRLGRDVLIRELGVPNYLRFMQQFGDGGGDYTAERGRWLDEVSLDDIRRTIEKRRSDTVSE